MTYDEWRLAGPHDDDPDPCECGEEDCTCAEDCYEDRGDYLYQEMKDREMDT